MRRGKLTHTLEFLKPSAAVTDGQQRKPAGEVTVHEDIPAQFVPKLGKEEYRNAEQRSSAPALFRFSYHPELAAIDTKWRVNDGTDIWQVAAFIWSGSTVDDMEIQVTRDAHK